MHAMWTASLKSLLGRPCWDMSLNLLHIPHSHSWVQRNTTHQSFHLDVAVSGSACSAMLFVLNFFLSLIVNNLHITAIATITGWIFSGSALLSAFFCDITIIRHGKVYQSWTCLGKGAKHIDKQCYLRSQLYRLDSLSDFHSAVVVIAAVTIAAVFVHRLISMAL